MPNAGKAYKQIHLTKMIAFLNQVLLHFSFIYKPLLKANSEIPQSYPPEQPNPGQPSMQPSAVLPEARAEPIVELSEVPTGPPTERSEAPTEPSVVGEIDMEEEHKLYDKIFEAFASKNNFTPFDS